MYKKILPSFVAVAMLSQNIVAKEIQSKENDKLADVSVSAGVTSISIEPIEDAEVNTDPIIWMKFNTTIYLGGFEPSFGYSRSFSNKTSNVTGKKDSKENGSMQINSKIPLDKIGLEGWSINYDKYIFNSYVTVDAEKKLIIVDKSNTTVKSGSINTSSDKGITQIEDGASAGLSITSERLEIRKNLTSGFAGADTSYIGAFIETLNKPWEDPTSEWEDSNKNKRVLIFAEAEFRSIGLTFGTTRKNKELSNGFSIKTLGFDLSFIDIKLTDNYSFKDKLKENMQTYKFGMKCEVAYKMLKGILGKDSSLVFNGFTNYDYYYLDINSKNDQDDSIDLSNDFLFGFSATLNF